MARIRTIKPEFFRSRSLARCSRDARMTFAGLWCEADDFGRGVADARILKGGIWPLDDDISWQDVEKHLGELEETGHIVRYDANGEDFFEIVAWAEHQSSAYRRGKAIHPASDGTVPHDEACKELQAAPPIVLEGKGKEGKGSASSDACVSEFDAIWSDYPRKIARKDALKAYQARRREGVLAEELARSVPLFAQAMKREKRDQDKIMHGSTFFGPGERWRDYLEPVVEHDPDEFANNLSRGLS